MSDMEPTTRDRVWAATFQVAETTNETGETFTTGDVLAEAGLDESHRRTAQRTLKAMEKMNWLENRGNSWEWLSFTTPTLE